MVVVVPFSRRQLLLVLLVAIVSLSACSSEVVLPDDADEQLITGFEVFNARCAQCHGRDGGGGIGLSVQEIEARLSSAEQRAVVVDGRRSMPSFGASLSEDDIDAVVRFTREVL